MRCKSWQPPVLPDHTDDACCFFSPAAANGTGLIEARRAFYTELSKLVDAGMSLQSAWVLFRMRLSTDWTWYARTTGLPKDMARRLDAMAVDEMVSHFVGNDLAEVSRKRVGHRLLDGGLGIPLLADSADAANTASWHSVFSGGDETTEHRR